MGRLPFSTGLPPFSASDHPLAVASALTALAGAIRPIFGILDCEGVPSGARCLCGLLIVALDMAALADRLHVKMVFIIVAAWVVVFVAIAVAVMDMTAI
jgi:hypothetical protein